MTDPKLISEINAELDRLQYEYTDKFIRFISLPFGLGAQITGRVETLICALAFGRKAIFDAADPPYTQVFSTMHQHLPALTEKEISIDPRISQSEKYIYYKPDEISMSARQMRELLLLRIRGKFNWHTVEWADLEGTVFNWMPLTLNMSEYCNMMRETLGIDRETLGVHYRRGDKKVESAYVPAATFNNTIAEIQKVWPYKKLFVASDSQRAIDEICTPDGVELIFDRAERRYNNANHRMIIGKPELAEDETKTAFKNIWLLAQCGGVVGQDNAHFATLSTSSIFSATGSNNGVLLDGKIAQKNSRTLDFYYRNKMAIRSLLRRIFPWATAASRVSRKESR